MYNTVLSYTNCIESVSTIPAGSRVEIATIRSAPTLIRVDDIVSFTLKR